MIIFNLVGFLFIFHFHYQMILDIIQLIKHQNYQIIILIEFRFKEAVINGKIKIVLILESYDEMKFEYIQTNLFYSNRLIQEFNILIPGKDVKIIITTRNEILTSIRYQTWFYGQNIKLQKKLNYNSAEYLKQYTEISNFCLDEFKAIWNQIYFSVQGIINQNKNQEMIFKSEDIEKLISKLQKIEFFSYIKGDQMVSLKKELLELWGHKKFTQVIRNVNINHLLSTPFMMEIIVYVLPKMSLIFSEANFLRELLKKNYMFLKMESFKSQSRTIKYEQQKKIRKYQQY
ncbi:unnamed protein product [Paramecium sonneborni]|uniref:Uncharacterized protein n=1 Tax=Paramecium sonneborni TaxID=65129 RepID=A0A8S1R490_9CILI|nr:unnamed protein product [Paramecium sonneborni]